MENELKLYTNRLEELAVEMGLDYYPVDFELVPQSFMTEVAVYGLPVRMPHWSFGVRYIYQFVQHNMGHSKLFEVVFPGDPSRAYLANSNSIAENTLVVAHVIGHADFSKNNALFRRSHEEVGAHIVEHAAAQAHQIADAIREHGQQRVEAVLDAALALEHHIDVRKGVRRPRYVEQKEETDRPEPDEFLTRYRMLPEESVPEMPDSKPQRNPVPPYPEYDLLWFIANYAPEMEGWERDIFLAVREESYYFFPIFACQIMNEGWASFTHARLLRNADFIPQQLYVDAMKTHSDVVRPYAGQRQVALAINPYHLGFMMWEKIVEDKGMDYARRILHEEDDFGFIRNYLDSDLADELNLFQFTASKHGEIRVEERDIHKLRETLLAPRFNYGAARIFVSALKQDGTLVLEHDYQTDGRGLDLARAQKVINYIQRVWRRGVILHTIDAKGKSTMLDEKSRPG